MPGLEYKIETAADLKALRDTEASLRAQIVAAKAAGKDFAALNQQLKSVSETIKNIPAPKRMGLEMADMVQGIPVLGNFARALNGLGGPITMAVGAMAGLANVAAAVVAAFAGAEAKMAKLDAVLAQNGQLTGGDIVSATEGFSKAMAGQFDVFGRLGIQVEKTGRPSQRLQSLMAQL